MKLFVHANTLVSGLLFAGNERLLQELGRLDVSELVTNAYVREEAREVLARSDLQLSEEDQRRLLGWLARIVRVIEDPAVGALRVASDRIPDAEDLPVVGFKSSVCNYLVMGDRMLRQAVPKSITTRRALRLILSNLESTRWIRRN